MKSQVIFLTNHAIIDTSFIELDSTPVAANASQNNPKSHLSNKFKPDNPKKLIERFFGSAKENHSFGYT